MKNKLAREAKEKLEQEKRKKAEQEKEEKARIMQQMLEKQKEEMERKKQAQLQRAHVLKTKFFSNSCLIIYFSCPITTIIFVGKGRKKKTRRVAAPSKSAGARGTRKTIGRTKTT